MLPERFAADHRACLGCWPDAYGQSETDRHVTRVAGGLGSRQLDDPFKFGHAERQAFTRGGGEDQSVDGQRRVVPHQPPQRGLIENAVAKRRNERQPEAVQ